MRTFSIVATLLCCLAQASAKPRVTLSTDGSLLYYSAPAATRIGHSIFAGWIEGNGAARIAKVVDGRRELIRTLHQFKSADDHEAPSIISDGGGLVAAVSAHSGDAFVYSVSLDDLSSKERCYFPGHFSYPRMIHTDAGLLLLLRMEFNDAGNLAVAVVGKDGCSLPLPIMTAAPGEWIYAAPPAWHDGALWITWSIYNLARNRHEGVFVTAVRDFKVGTVTTLVPRRQSGPETLAWSIDGEHVRYTEFSGAMGCCAKGTMHTVTLDMAGREIARTPERPMPYYPSRADVPANCTDNALPAMAQPIDGGGGFVLSEILGNDHDAKKFDSDVALCLAQ